MDKLDWDYLGLEAQRRMAQKLRDQYLDGWHNGDDHQHDKPKDDRLAESQHRLDTLTKRMDALLKLYVVRKLTPPNYDDWKKCLGEFAPKRPALPDVPDAPKPAPAAPALSMGDLPMFQTPKKGQRRK